MNLARQAVRIALLVCCATELHAASFAPALQDDERETHSFHIPIARTARALAEEVEEHVAAQRWSNAIAGLQKLIEQHQSEILPSSFRPSAHLPSDYEAYPGAAYWAERRLRALPGEVIDLYRDRYELTAQAALALAMERGDKRLVAEVARRYPLTRTATRAWWILGDLELESGYAENALAAWEQALATTDEIPAGAEARLALARERMPLGSNSSSREHGPAARVPQGDADTWSREVDLSPIARSGSSYAFNVLPLISGDRVLTTNTHVVTSYDAFTGEEQWSFGPPPGWEKLSRRSERELLEGINYDRLLVAPAVGGNVVVATLQIPYSRDTNHNWQNIEIIRSIPERRLFAFDLETGALLWTHSPTLHYDEERRIHVWDDTFASYQERMLVAAPPTIAGTRVLVPCYRLQGRIDYQVACYDLFSGEHLWSTALISGQRERNMFGRANMEYVGSPVTVAGSRVIAQTELGTVAALDLATGRILWESLYQKQRLLKNYSYDAPESRPAWRERAPVVAGGVVIATPSDSDDILAYDLEDGRVLWSQSQYLLRTRYSTKPEEIDLLVGADEDSIYLAGQQLLVLQKPGGIGSRSAFVPRRPDLLDDARERMRPRALLAPEEIIVPLRGERRVFDRRSVEIDDRATAPWTSKERGNLALGRGVLFSLSRDRLTAYFAWDTLLARQRKSLQEHPNDPSIAVATAEILTRRGLSLLENDGDTASSLRHFLEARKVLEPRIAKEIGGMRHRLRDALHGVLRGEAQARIAVPDRSGALAVLDEALDLVTNPEDRRDTLFERERLLRDGPLRPRLELWARMEADVGSLPLPETLFGEAPTWLIGEAFVDPDELSGWEAADLDVGLWVLLNRALERARARDTAGALEDLHLALARGGEIPLGGTRLGVLIGERIARRLELDGRRNYGPFEAEAQRLLTAAEGSGRAEDFALVSRLYPHSEAATLARGARLESAFAARDAHTVAALVYDPHTRRTREEETEAILRVGALLESEGNPEIVAAMLAALATEDPTRRVEVDGVGAGTLAELSRTKSSRQPAGVAVANTFGPAVSLGRSYMAGFRLRGELSPAQVEAESPSAPLHIYVAPDEILAFGADDPGLPRWTYALPFTLSQSSSRMPTCALGGDRVLVASALGDGGLLLAIDAEGQLAWTQATERGRIRSVVAEGGIALVQLESPNRVLAYDAHSGTPLWSIDLGPAYDWRPPVLGEGRAVYLSFRHGAPSVGAVIDLFRGRLVTELSIGRIEKRTNQSAWIRAGLLLVPNFSASRSPSGITGFDLVRGTKTKLVEFDANEELSSIVQCEGRDYLVAVSTGPQSRGRSGGVYAFDAELKSLRSVVALEAGERPMGVRDKERVVLDDPFLFVYGSSTGSRPVQVQAIHLPFERRWSYSLPVKGEDLHDDGLSLPALSEEYVAFVFRTKRGGRRYEAQLVFVDKNGGLHRDGRVLPPEFASDSRIELHGHGPALVILGHNRNESRIEILEELR